MGFIKFLIWTSCSMALGIYISTARYEGGTPLEQMQKVWRSHGPSAEEKVRSDVRKALDSARTSVRASAPVEQHTREDREAVNKLIAGRSAPK